MTDILVRVCVGACGLTLVVASGMLLDENKPVQAGGMFVLGLIAMLRALGVL